MNNSLCVHYKHLELLAIELCKVFNGISPDAMKDIFP